jgi:hypothetical protein
MASCGRETEPRAVALVGLIGSAKDAYTLAGVDAGDDLGRVRVALSAVSVRGRLQKRHFSDPGTQLLWIGQRRPLRLLRRRSDRERHRHGARVVALRVLTPLRAQPIEA